MTNSPNRDSHAGYGLAVAAQLLGRFGAMVANLVSLALAARALPEAQFGIFVLVTGLVQVLAQVADFGTGPVFGQHVGALAASTAPRLGGRFWGSFLLVRAGLAAVATLLGVALSFTFSGAAADAMLLASAAVVFAAARFLDPLFQVARRPFRSTMTQFVGAGSVLGLSALAAFAHPTLRSFLLAFVVANAVYVGVSLLFVRDLIEGHTHAERATMRRILAVAAPIGAAALMTAVNGRANLLFLAHFRGADALAVYGAATRVLDLAINLAVLVLSPLIPVFSRSAMAGVDGLASQVRRSTRLLLQLTLPLLVASSSFSPLVMRLLYGARYAGAGPVMDVLALVGFGVAFSLLASYALLSMHITRYSVWITGAAVVANLALNAMLVPLAGAMGAAVAAVGTELVLVTLVIVALVRHVPGAIDMRETARMLALAALAWLLLHLLGTHAREFAAGLVLLFCCAPLWSLWRERVAAT